MSQPIGEGLGAVARVVSGSARAQIGAALVTYTITGGSIERDASGRLVARLHMQSSLPVAADLAERMGWNDWHLVSRQSALSSDGTAPTVFEQRREEPGMTWHTTASGSLTAKRFVGRFEQAWRLAGVPVHVSGPFELLLN